MTLHRSALLFYLPFPAFYCSTLSPFHHPNSRFTLSSFHLSNIQKDILISYSFTFPSFKSSFFTFNSSPFHHPNRHFSLLTPHLSTFKQPLLIGHPLLGRGLGRPLGGVPLPLPFIVRGVMLPTECQSWHWF